MIGFILAGLGGIAAGAVGAVVLQQTALKSKAAAILREAERKWMALKRATYTRPSVRMRSSDE